MATSNSMSELEIGSKIRAGKSFRVNTERERKWALAAAKFAGKVIKTTRAEDGKFDILFFQP